MADMRTRFVVVGNTTALNATPKIERQVIQCNSPYGYFVDAGGVRYDITSRIQTGRQPDPSKWCLEIYGGACLFLAYDDAKPSAGSPSPQQWNQVPVDAIIARVIAAAAGGGSGSGPDYTFSEINLGRKWHDGRDIYRKTTALTATFTLSTTPANIGPNSTYCPGATIILGYELISYPTGTTPNTGKSWGGLDADTYNGVLRLTAPYSTRSFVLPGWITLDYVK